MIKNTLILVYREDTKSVTLKFSYNKRFSTFIKKGIKPLSYRKWNGSTWEVHVSKIVYVVKTAKKHFAKVEHSNLPSDIARLVDHVLSSSDSENRPYVKPSTISPHSILNLTDNAPMEVVKASYKALAMKYHPDRGGSSETFVAIQKAYDEIKKGNE